jgi:ferric-dicitrate binding protein FerR (iron transport regulator)
VSHHDDALGELVRVVGRRRNPPREHYEQVLEAATLAWQRKLRSRRRRWWLCAAAASVVTIGIALITFRQLSPSEPTVATAVVPRGNVAVRLPNDDAWRPLQPGAAILQGSQLRTGTTAGIALLLGGGTAVRMKEQSEVELQSREALRLETGTLYVDSGADPRRSSVRIETERGVVRDVGTVFEVHARGKELRIRVREGLVALDSSGSSETVETRAGEQLSLDARGTLLRSSIAAHDAEWRWAEALVTPPDVEGRPLLYFLNWVARETGRRLQFQEPEIELQAREVVLHGRTRDLAPLQALDLMLSTTDLEYVLPADDVIVVRRRTE